MLVLSNAFFAVDFIPLRPELLCTLSPFVTALKYVAITFSDLRVDGIVAASCTLMCSFLRWTVEHIVVIVIVVIIF